jgi:hypothetical protein
VVKRKIELKQLVVVLWQSEQECMAKKGLRAWVKENWVDIANKRSDGSYPKCGRSGGEKRKNYPKCVPIAKARAMSKGQRAGAKPSRAATFAPKRKKMGLGGLV